MKNAFLFALVLLAIACGGKTAVRHIVIGPVCTEVADCHCPADYEPSCEDNTCLCLGTEVVVIQPDAGSAGSPTGTGGNTGGTGGFVGSAGTAGTDDITIAIETINNFYPIVIEGQSELLSIRYLISGTSAANPLTDLRVINQPDGEGSAPKSTLGIEIVRIYCAPPSGSGVYTFFDASLVDGIAQFSNLNCYDETGNGLEVDVGYDVAHIEAVGDILSGQVFRLVLDDDRLVDSQAELSVGVVRKTMLYFSNVFTSQTLVNGERTLFSFQAVADNNGSADLARLVFDADKFDADGDGSLKFSNFKFYRDSTLIVANIFDQMGHDISAVVLESSKFVVSFPNGEVIPAGTSSTFTLKATATGVELDDTFTTSLDSGDEVRPVVGMNAETTPNTARLISVNGGGGLFLDLTDFLFSTPDDRNVIWSDQSADVHVYSIQSDVSSYDFTNGYALGVNQLVSVTIGNY